MEHQLTVALEEVQRPLTLEDLSGTLDALSCLLRAAERHAPEYGPSGRSGVLCRCITACPPW